MSGYTFSESLSPEEKLKAKPCGSDLDSKKQLEELIVVVQNSSGYRCNPVFLLKKFTSISSMYWSMLWYSEEWEHNDLEDFRNRFMNHIETKEPFKDTFNAAWLIKQINIKYSQFKTINGTSYCPSWLYMLGIIALGAIGGVLISTFLLDAPEFSYYIGATIGATLLCEMLVFKNYLSERTYLLQERGAFPTFCTSAKRILNDKKIPLDGKISEGIKSEDSYEFFMQERSKKSIVNCWRVGTLFAHKNTKEEPPPGASMSASIS